MLLHLSMSSHKEKIKLHKTVINSVPIFRLWGIFLLGEAKVGILLTKKLMNKKVGSLLNVTQRVRSMCRSLYLVVQACVKQFTQAEGRKGHLTILPNIIPSLTRKWRGKVTVAFFWVFTLPLLPSKPFHYPALQWGTQESKVLEGDSNSVCWPHNVSWGEGVTSFWGCPAALKGGAACSSHTGAPPWTICSRSHTRLMKAHSVHVTTKQPCKQSANKLSLLKKNYIHYSKEHLKLRNHR